MCILHEGFVSLREGFVVAPWRLREAFSKTRSAKASRSFLEGFARASRRRHGRLHLETIRQIMTSPPPKYNISLKDRSLYFYTGKSSTEGTIQREDVLNFD